MHDKEIDGKKLYCVPALSKEDRQKEIELESFKYENSKRRLNLFVKGFAEGTTEDDLRPFFAPFGPIESIRVIKSEGKPKPHAFVCYYTPDAASEALKSNIVVNG
jgi:RNA recognition motif-containing protein